MRNAALLLLLCLCMSSSSGEEERDELDVELHAHFEPNKAFLYAQILRREGFRHLKDASYRSLRDAGIVSVHDQLRIMKIMRALDRDQSEDETQELSLPQRLLFSINTGRSGSRYLASILDSCVGVVGEHEPGPGPGGSRNMMRELLEDSFQERAQLKNSAIRRVMQSSRATSRQATTYAETNPNFKVWIWDVTLEEFGRVEGKPIDILVVRKYLPALVKSVYELGWYQHGSRAGESWLPTANSVNSLIKPLAPDSKLDAFDKIISSLINTEAVAQHIMQRYSDPSSPDYLPTVTFHEYRSEELFDGQRMLEVLRTDLQLQPSAHTEELAGVTIDKYRGGREHSGALRPAAHTTYTTLEECEQRVHAYIEACETAGISLPFLPHLQRYPGFSYT